MIETSAETGDAHVYINFRKDKNYNYYRFQFSNDSQYRVLLHQDQKWDYIQDWTPSEAIRLTPGVANTFAILVKGSVFTLYANDQELGTVTDITLSEAGKIELGIDLDKADQSLTVDFDNLVIKEAS